MQDDLAQSVVTCAGAKRVNGIKEYRVGVLWKQCHHKHHKHHAAQCHAAQRQYVLDPMLSRHSREEAADGDEHLERGHQ